MCPRGEFKVLWAAEDSVAYEIKVASGSHSELTVTIPKTIAHLFKKRERVRVIIEKLKRGGA